jgi:hypothetical protein
MDADSADPQRMEPGMEETDTTSGLDSSVLEGNSSQSSAAAGLTTLAGPTVPASPSFVYALGQIEPRFPSLAVEKEFVQVSGRADAAGLTNREVLQTILTDRANRYLVRELCWVFMIQGLETYLLAPRDPADLDLLVEATRPRPNPTDLDVVIGVRGPLASPQACNGLIVPMVAFDQLYSFDRDALLAAIPRPNDVPDKEDKRFRATAAELFDSILQMADNAGATDEHRALNYLSVRYPAIYARTATAHAGNASLSAVDVRPSRLSGVRKVVDVIFSYTHRQTDVTEKYLVRVDVTEEFPFLVAKLAPYYDR